MQITKYLKTLLFFVATCLCASSICASEYKGFIARDYIESGWRIRYLMPSLERNKEIDAKFNMILEGTKEERFINHISMIKENNGLIFSGLYFIHENNERNSYAVIEVKTKVVGERIIADLIFSVTPEDGQGYNLSALYLDKYNKEVLVYSPIIIGAR